MSAAASNPTVALAGLTTKATEAVTVVADAVDASNVIADKYTPIADATITDAHIGVEHAVIAAVGAVPATKATEAVTVVAYAVDASDVIADKYTPIADATITNAHIGVEHAVIAAVGAVPAAHNNVTTTPHTNLMSASRRESSLPM